MKPLIGITPNISPGGDPKRSFSATQTIYYIHREYGEFIRAGGGVPILLFPEDGESAREIVARIDGLLVSGGADVDPSTYGEEQAGSRGCDANRDRYEISVIRAAREARCPVFGICRGLQIMNVAYGGTLHQHIYDHFTTGIRHHRDPDGNEGFHEVSIVDTCRSGEGEAASLSAVLGNSTVRVNSTHHQAIDRVGNGLGVAAVAPDGVIEAIVSTTDRCVSGVQWHPERMGDDEVQRRIAAWFVGSCRR